MAQKETIKAAGRHITLAGTAGFCFGVQRAVDLVEAEAKRTDGPIYTYGPIIHNTQEVDRLSGLGVRVLPEDADLSDEAAWPRGVVILRSHGVARSVEETLMAFGFSLVDATCPFVKKIHRLVSEHAKAGAHIVIVGDPSHPEVQGIIGWIPEGTPYTVLPDVGSARSFSVPAGTKILIVSQTTFYLHKFEEVIEILSGNDYDICAVNTICDATARRQEEAARIAAGADVMLVVGGRNSSNSQKLYRICGGVCADTRFIETAAELDMETLRTVREIGITAGASTPKFIIEEVLEACRN